MISATEPLADSLPRVYRPNPPQYRFHATTVERRWFCAGYGTGKTTSAVFEAWDLATRIHPGCTGIIVAPTFPLLTQALLAEWRLWIPSECYALNQSRWEMALPNGSRIVWRSTSNPDSGEGMNAAWLVFDEATREHSRESYAILSSRVRRGYPGRRRMTLLTGPPQGAGHWTAKEFGTGPGGDRVGDAQAWVDGAGLHAVIRARTRDNPHLPPDYEAKLRASPGATKAWCRQYLDAEFVAGEGQIFEGFDRAVHVVKPDRIPSTFRRVVVGVDWGFSHAGAMIVVGVTGTGTLYVLHEEVRRGVAVTDSGWLGIARSLRDLYRPERFVADPSEPGYITTLRQTLGGRPVVENANNDVAEGIRRIVRALEPIKEPGTDDPRQATLRPRLYVSERCTRLIEELESYRYREVRGQLTEQPQEHDDDAIDALRYAVMACTAHT